MSKTINAFDYFFEIEKIDRQLPQEIEARKHDPNFDSSQGYVNLIEQLLSVISPGSKLEAQPLIQNLPIEGGIRKAFFCAFIADVSISRSKDVAVAFAHGKDKAEACRNLLICMLQSGNVLIAGGKKCEVVNNPDMPTNTASGSTNSEEAGNRSSPHGWRNRIWPFGHG